MLGVVDPLAQPAQRASHQRRAHARQRPRTRDLFAHHAEHRLGGALDPLQHDVAGEAVGHDHVGLPFEDVTPLDVADVAERGLGHDLDAGQDLVRFARQRRPLVLFRAVRQQADLGPRLSVQQARVHRAEHAELGQHRRLRVDVGAHVQQRALTRSRRERGHDGGPLDAGQAPQHEQAAGHHRARVTGRHDGVRLPRFDEVEADPHRRLLLLLHRHRRRVVHRDHVRRVPHDDRRLLGAQRLQLGAQPRLVTDQHDVDAARAHGGHHALHLDSRGGVGAHGIDGDSRHLRAGTRRAGQACSSSLGAMTSRSR